MDLHVKDILTRTTRYNLIRDGRMIYIDLHQRIQGRLADAYIAVPNLVNIVAAPAYQGAGPSEKQALEDCLKKIKGLGVSDLFPQAGRSSGEGAVSGDTGTINEDKGDTWGDKGDVPG